MGPSKGCSAWMFFGGRELSLGQSIGQRIMAALFLVSIFHSFAHPGPAQHLFNLFILWLHQHGELQVLDGVLMSAEHLLQHEQKH